MADVIEVDFTPKLDPRAALETVQQKLARIERDLAVLETSEKRRIREARMWESWQRRRLFKRVRYLQAELHAERANQFDDEAVYAAVVAEVREAGQEVAAKTVASRLLKYPTHSAAVRVGLALSRLERAGKVRRMPASGHSSYRWRVEARGDA